ncbi:hypothetical protein DM01DRAFT_1339153, partial [Hesseltinella vesiculosa]
MAKTKRDACNALMKHRRAMKDTDYAYPSEHMPPSPVKSMASLLVPKIYPTPHQPAVKTSLPKKNADVKMER